MNTTCPNEEDFESYVLAALPAERHAALEAHVSGCAACMQRLQAEAALEVRLWEVGDALRGERPRPTWWRTWQHLPRLATAPRRSLRLVPVGIAACLLGVAAVVLSPHLFPLDVAPAGPPARPPVEAQATAYPSYEDAAPLPVVRSIPYPAVMGEFPHYEVSVPTRQVAGRRWRRTHGGDPWPTVWIEP